jgi:peptide deformylase
MTPVIRKWPDPCLTTPAEPVKEFGPSLVQLLETMCGIMRTNHAIGLAAPQIGVSLRAIVVYEAEAAVPFSDIVPVLCMVNPEIIDSSGQFSMREGCLSVEAHYVTVARPARIRVRWQDTNGYPQVRWFESIRYPDLITAQIVGHEIDHLDGKTIIHYE